MNKLSKLTALLLALVLALSVPLGALAESTQIETKSEYYEAAKDVLYNLLMSQTEFYDYQAVARALQDEDFTEFVDMLTEEEYTAIVNEVVELYWAACHTYINVGPFMPPVDVSAAGASTYNLRSETREAGIDPYAEAADNGVILEKSVTDNGNGTYTIQLESYVTGKVKTETITESVPCDIVLVLDYSNSMTKTENAMEGGVLRSEALITAVNAFIDETHAKYDEETADHRIAVVKFNSSATTGTLTDVNDRNVNGLKINNNGHGSGTRTDLGLLEAYRIIMDDTNRGSITYVSNAWGSTSTRSVTGTYEYEGDNTKRQKVVIVFTDGQPTSSGIGTDDFKDTPTHTKTDEYCGGYVGREAINLANELKAAGVTVFGVAVFPGAYPTNTIVNPPVYALDIVDNEMHAISSNYPNATATDTNWKDWSWTVNWGTDGSQTAGYYETAGSAEDLKKIFKTISEQIQTGSASIELGTTTSVQDVVTPYFDLPANASSVRVYTVDAFGFDDAGKPIWKTKQGSTTEEDLVSFDTATVKFGKTISTTGADGKTTYTFVEASKLPEGTKPDTVYVANFDYKNHYVADVDTHVDPWGNVTENFYGRKLVVEFEITPVDGFLGGNNVETNLGGSGIWSPDTQNNPVKDFENPDNVDVEVWKITVKGKHQHIFLSNEADMNALLQSFSLVYTKEGFPDETYEVNGIRNDYAKLIFTLKAKSNQAMRYVIEPGKTVGVWEYYDAAGNKIDDAASFDVTPFLTGDEDGVADGTTPYTISYEVIPKNEGTYKKTTGSLDVGVHVYKPTFTFQDTTEDYLAPATADGYYKKNNFVSESWSHTYYNEITVTINVTYDANGTPSYSYVVTSNKEGVDPIYSPAGWDLSQTIDFSGYGSTEGEKYKVTMSGPKPTVTFSYDRDEKDWITDGKVTEVECVKVNVNAVTLTSNNKHEKVEQGSDGAVSRGEYTSTSVYTEGSGSASVSIDGGTATTLPTGHITTKRVEVACTACGTTDDHVRTTNINSDAVYEFVVHIKNAFSELKIIKEGLSVGESAIFTVTGYVPDGTADGEQKTWTVVLTKTSADDPFVTITGLLVNSQATVAEDGNWSWRYKTTTYDPTSASVWIIPKTTTGYPATVTVSNGGRTDQWLSDEVAVKNDFSVNGSGTVID